jgi:hypothetical protein
MKRISRPISVARQCQEERDARSTKAESAAELFINLFSPESRHTVMEPSVLSAV